MELAGSCLLEVLGRSEENDIRSASPTVGWVLPESRSAC